VLAINKIDLVDYDEETLTAIAKDFAGLARSLGFPDDAVVTIPVSALVGDNVVERSERTPWYDGPTLLGHLESVPVVGPECGAVPDAVQYVIRPRREFSGADELHDYRGYAGQVASGTVAPGDEVVVLPGGAPHHGGDGRHRGRSAGRRRRAPERDDPARGRHRHLPRRPARRSGRAATGDERARDDGLLARGEAAAPRRPAAAQARHRTTQVIVGAITERLDPETLRFGEAPAQLQINDIAHVGMRTADALPVDDYCGRPRDGQLPAHRPADRQHAGRRADRVPARGRPGLSPRRTTPRTARHPMQRSGVRCTNAAFAHGPAGRVSAASRPGPSPSAPPPAARRRRTAAAPPPAPPPTPRRAAGHVRPHVVPRHPVDQPGLDTEEPADPVRRLHRRVAQLAVADQQHLLAGEQREQVVELLAVAPMAA
jgi:hypothetical protein